MKASSLLALAPFMLFDLVCASQEFTFSLVKGMPAYSITEDSYDRVEPYTDGIREALRSYGDLVTKDRSLLCEYVDVGRVGCEYYLTHSVKAMKFSCSSTSFCQLKLILEEGKRFGQLDLTFEPVMVKKELKYKAADAGLADIGPYVREIKLALVDTRYHDIETCGFTAKYLDGGGLFFSCPNSVRGRIRDIRVRCTKGDSTNTFGCRIVPTFQDVQRSWNPLTW